MKFHPLFLPRLPLAERDGGKQRKGRSSFSRRDSFIRFGSLIKVGKKRQDEINQRCP